MPRLLKKMMTVVDVLPSGLRNVTVEDAVKKLLGSLSQMPFQIATISNTMGTGHGKADSFTGLEPRHAILAAG